MSFKITPHFNVKGCSYLYRCTQTHGTYYFAQGVRLGPFGFTQKNQKTYYTLLKGPTPNHIIPHIPMTVATTHYNLRNRNDVRPPQTRLQASLNSFFPKTIREQNSLSPQVRATSKHSFKRAISSNYYANPYTKVHYGKCGAWIGPGLLESEWPSVGLMPKGPSIIINIKKLRSIFQIALKI